MNNYKIIFGFAIIAVLFACTESRPQDDEAAAPPAGDDAGAAPPPPPGAGEKADKKKKEKAKKPTEPGQKCACTPERVFVCGADGKTYGNECLMNCKGVKKAQDGKCPQGKNNKSKSGKDPKSKG